MTFQKDFNAGCLRLTMVEYIITHIGGSNGVNTGQDLCNIDYPSLTTPIPCKSQKILFDARELGSNLLQPIGD